jgi:hypothetical protein
VVFWKPEIKAPEVHPHFPWQVQSLAHIANKDLFQIVISKEPVLS